MGKYAHSPGRLAAIIFCILVFLAMSVFMILAIDYHNNALYDVDQRTVWTDVWPTEMVPASWTYYGLIVVYIWQFLWLCYALSTTCNVGVGAYLYCCPYLPTSVYVVYMLNNILNVIWQQLFDREELIAAFVAMTFVAFSALAAFALAVRGTYKHGAYMEAVGLKNEIRWTVFSVHNGLALYAAYACILTLVNFSQVLVHEIDVEDWPDYPDLTWQQDAVTICLGIMAFEIVLWTALDLTVFDRMTRWVFTPYLAFGWLSVGILEENWYEGSRNSMINIGIVGAVMLAVVVKFTTMIWRFLTGFNSEVVVVKEVEIAKVEQPTMIKVKKVPIMMQPQQVMRPVSLKRRVTQLMAPSNKLVGVDYNSRGRSGYPGYMLNKGF